MNRPLYSTPLGVVGVELVLLVSALASITAGYQVVLQNTRATAQEMPGIVVCVKSNKIAIEHALQKLLSYGQDAVDLAAGEGRVKEEADLDSALGLGDLLAQHLRQQHQVVVVYPNKVSVLHILDDFLGKEPIDLAVGRPGRLIERDLAGVVVEKGPEDGVCWRCVLERTLAKGKARGRRAYSQSRCNAGRQARRPQIRARRRTHPEGVVAWDPPRPQGPPDRASHTIGSLWFWTSRSDR
jgi:hypothetical protein